MQIVLGCNIRFRSTELFDEAFEVFFSQDLKRGEGWHFNSITSAGDIKSDGV